MQLMTVSTETIRMAKSRPEKNQSARADLPCHIINISEAVLIAVNVVHGHVLP